MYKNQLVDCVFRLWKSCKVLWYISNIRFFFHNKISYTRNFGIHFLRECLLITYCVPAFQSLGCSRTEQNSYFKKTWSTLMNNTDKNPCPHGSVIPIIVSITIQVEANYPELLR